MLWFVIALQAMTPFVHAHAGAAQLKHTGLPHVHAGVPGDVAYHAMESGEQGAEVKVAGGVPVRQAALVVASAAASFPVPAAPPLQPSLADHALPHALAPPRG